MSAAILASAALAFFIMCNVLWIIRWRYDGCEEARNGAIWTGVAAAMFALFASMAAYSAANPGSQSALSKHERTDIIEACAESTYCDVVGLARELKGVDGK